LSTEPQPRRIGRRILVLAALALAGSTAFITWWSTTLVGLPDVGDPFDVQAFARPIPDETNAFVLYKQASALLPKEPDAPANYDCKTADTEQRAWFERSQEALAIWRKGIERPDASYVNPTTANFDTKLDVVQNLRSFGRLALVKGSRLEDSGDFEGALDWYLALLRSSRHCGKRGTMIERLIGIAMHRWVSTRLTRWAADPKVDARMLRRALDASIAADAATPPTSDVVKLEYLGLLHSFNDPEMMVRILDYEVVPDGKGGSVTKYGQQGWKASLTRLHRRAINDPERSRRVIRLIFANWLAYCDLPPSEQPPKVKPGTGQTLTGPASAIVGEFFVAGKDAPASARVLPPEELARWFGSTLDARTAVPAFASFERALARERSAQAALLFNLANELYKREHGQYPGCPEDLLGTYLKALPEGYKPTN
jgi:hypothetical protein